MAPHSSTLAWKIPWTEELGRLQSMGSLRVGHDWATSLSLFTFLHWRRKWQPTPVRLPGKSHGQRSLVGCSPWGHYESDTTETGTQVSWQLPALQVDSLPLSLQGSRDTVYRVSNKNLSRHSKYIPSCILREIFFFLSIGSSVAYNHANLR